MNGLAYNRKNHTEFVTFSADVNQMNAKIQHYFGDGGADVVLIKNSKQMVMLERNDHEVTKHTTTTLNYHPLAKHL